MTDRNELTPSWFSEYLSGLLATNQRGGGIVSEANAIL